MGSYNSDFMPEGAFENCTSLKELVLSDDIKWGQNTFKGCKNISRIDIEGIISLPEGFFRGCESLTTLDLECIDTIADGAIDSDSPIRKLIEKHLNGERVLPDEKWINKSKEEDRIIRTAEEASVLFIEKMNQWINRDIGNSKICPLCEMYTVNLFGKCTNKQCVSYKKTAANAVVEMAAKIKNRKCPACGKPLKMIEIYKRYGTKQKHLSMKCSNYYCRLSLLRGWN